MEKWKLLSQRLNWAIEQKLQADPSIKKITNAALAKVAGVSPTAAGYWFADTNGINAEQARKVGEFLDVDPVWLEKNKGEPRSSSGKDQEAAKITALIMSLPKMYGKALRLLASRYAEIAGAMPKSVLVLQDPTSETFIDWHQMIERNYQATLKNAARAALDQDISAAMKENAADFKNKVSEAESATKKIRGTSKKQRIKGK